MNTFYVTGFAYAMHEISRAKLAFTMLEQTGHAMEKPSGKPAELMEIVLNKLGNIIPDDKQECMRAWEAAKNQWSDDLLNVSRAVQIAGRLEDDLVAGTMKREFLWIARDRENLTDQEALFGQRVAANFSTAAGDIREAGNCLAAECCTGCVFHLMRAAEVALRAVARDRDVEFANKPLEQQEWATIVSNLDSKLTSLRGTDLKNWPQPGVRDIQLRFYHEVIQELRGFNEAWRRHISHAREDAFYGRGYAVDIMKHVRKFMQNLATKISENSTTPKYWTENEAKLGS